MGFANMISWLCMTLFSFLLFRSPVPFLRRPRLLIAALPALLVVLFFFWSCRLLMIAVFVMVTIAVWLIRFVISLLEGSLLAGVCNG